MPFIGTQPEVGGYSVLDALTASATASYTLQLNSVNFSPSSANQLLVSLNGVIQKPGSSFTVSGSTLTFSSALDSSDSIDFIIAMGEPLLIGTPSDATVTGNKLASNIGISTTGNIATTGSGTMTSAGLITASAGVDVNGTELVLDADGDTSIEASTDDTIQIKIAGSEKLRLDSDGDVIIGKTAQNNTAVGTVLQNDGFASFVRDGGPTNIFNRLNSDGTLLELRKDGATKGTLGIGTAANSTSLFIGFGDTGFSFQAEADNKITPCIGSSGAKRDNGIDLGHSSARWNDGYFTNGVTTGSDQNEKQDIESLTTKELKVANKLSALFKTYKWKDRVAEKGDKARIHSGIIAQDIQSAFSAEGLDASNYGMFMSNTWTNEEGKEQTRLGVRYPELFSFIFSSIDARLTALESK